MSAAPRGSIMEHSIILHLEGAAFALLAAVALLGPG
jgi:hypothetical protein